MTYLDSLPANFNSVIVGTSGGIGSALLSHIDSCGHSGKIFALSRGEMKSPSAKSNKVTPIAVDIESEKSIIDAVEQVGKDMELDLVLVATGVLHNQQLQPEKVLSSISPECFSKVIAVNTLAPMLLAKHLLPLMRKRSRTLFTVLSARVGSISDNRLGGWYSYRASKAALNMFLKSLAIETSRQNPQLIVAGLHPGTVDSDLSRPFSSRVQADKLFRPEQAAGYLLKVIDRLQSIHSGRIFAWDGSEIDP